MSVFCAHAPLLLLFATVSISSQNVNRCSPFALSRRFSSFATEMLAGTQRTTVSGSCGCCLAFFASRSALRYCCSSSRALASSATSGAIHLFTSIRANDLPLACGAVTTVMNEGEW